MRKPVILILVPVLALCIIVLAVWPFVFPEPGPPEPMPPPAVPSSPPPEPEPLPEPFAAEPLPPEVELENVPEGAVFDPETRTFSWQTQPGDAGIYLNVCFTVTDPGGLSDTECITIIVFSSNQEPVLSQIPIQVVDLGGVLTFTLQASDPDGDEIEFFAQNLPPGSQFSPPTFSWAPTETGIWPGLIFGVTDGEEKTTQQVIIAVT